MADIYTAIRARCLPINARIAELAARQHGVVALWQLALVGIGPSAVQRRVEGGLLHPIHAGVYAVGHPKVSELGRFSAARLAIGPGAAVTGYAAVVIHGFDDDACGGAPEVIVARGRARGRPGIRLYRTRQLPPQDLAFIEGIWVTSVPRTLIEIAGRAPWRRVRRLYEEADRIHLVDRRAVAEALDRCFNRKGIGTLRRLNGRHRAPVPRTESHAEYRFFRLWEETGRPLPEVNVKVDGFLVDFLWRDLRLIVELDGPSYHDRQGQGERDRRRDVELSLAGYRVHRWGTDRVYERPQRLIEEVAGILELRRREFARA